MYISLHHVDSSLCSYSDCLENLYSKTNWSADVCDVFTIATTVLKDRSPDRSRFAWLIIFLAVDCLYLYFGTNPKPISFNNNGYNWEIVSPEICDHFRLYCIKQTDFEILTKLCLYILKKNNTSLNPRPNSLSLRNHCTHHLVQNMEESYQKQPHIKLVAWQTNRGMWNNVCVLRRTNYTKHCSCTLWISMREWKNLAFVSNNNRLINVSLCGDCVEKHNINANDMWDM